jgi:hypothetical protein
VCWATRNHRLLVSPPERARLARSTHSSRDVALTWGHWPHAAPTSDCGVRLCDEAVRVALGPRRSTELCRAHQRAARDAGLSRCARVSRLALRTRRTQAERGVSTTLMTWFGEQFKRPAVNQPRGLTRSDGRQPDVMTLKPWRGGRSDTSDVTVIDAVRRTLPRRSVIQIAQHQPPKPQHSAKTASAPNCLKLISIPIGFRNSGPHQSSWSRLHIRFRTSYVTEDTWDISVTFQRLSDAALHRR